MLRTLALTLSLFLASAAPALAQAHPPHAPGHPHGPEHMPVDSATHAALHALLHGNWMGTLTSARGISSRMEMSVAHDSLRQAILTIRADQALRAGATSDVVIDGNSLRWTQTLSDTRCEATATLKAATPRDPATMNGRMLCGEGKLTFALRKTE